MYRDLIEEQVGVQLVLPAGGKTVRVPNPEVYKGQADIELFDNWLYAVLRWMKVNQIGRPEREQEQITVLPCFLKGEAATWYNNNVDGLGRKRHTWTFEDVVIGIYNRFLHEACIQEATVKYQKVRYNSKRGVAAFYNDMQKAAAWMVHPPDMYSFKSHLLFGLPKAMMKEVL
jgi:hypothetical protein